MPGNFFEDFVDWSGWLPSECALGQGCIENHPWDVERAGRVGSGEWRVASGQYWMGAEAGLTPAAELGERHAVLYSAGEVNYC